MKRQEQKQPFNGSMVKCMYLSMIKH